MSGQLRIALGQYSDKGRKAVNQDFHGFYIPKPPLLTTKGIAIALADGISSSEVSQVAAEAAVSGFLTDYFCTPEAWSVKRSAQRVLRATNSWLYAHTRQSQYRYDADKGYVCTFSAMAIKAGTAHIFHVGDTRIYRRQGNTLEQLTHDHRLWLSKDKSCLSRALGINQQVEIDYQALPIEKGDVFVLASDGVYEFVSANSMVEAIDQHFADLDAAAKLIVEQAFYQGSDDNLTVQIVRIDALSDRDGNAIYRQANELAFPPILDARMELDGYKIIRPLHASSRSHVYLALNHETDTPVVIKAPSIDLRGDEAYLERFLMEEWIARRIDSPYVLKSCSRTGKRDCLYLVTEFIDGQTLKQWMLDNPKPNIAAVRDIVEQIAKGLRAFHRLEMLHQDLRPDNIMIDSTGTVKIIDFGSTKVAGLSETIVASKVDHILGTAQYTAPEYFLGEGGTARSDLYSLGVITYQMLSGRLPYGVEVVKARTRAAQMKLKYRSVLHDEREIPAWIDEVLKKAVHPNPYRRYDDLSEFIHELREPNPAFLNKSRPPLMERDPVLFWKGVSLMLTLIIVALLISRE
ncbi:MAG: protein kinase domain-containing protein [Gammaproteobacteria bacterium]